MKNKVSYMKSIQLRLTAIVGVFMLISTCLLILISIPNLQKNTEILIHDYLKDEAEAYGMLLDTVVNDKGMYVLENYDNMNLIMSGIKLAGYETSYAYVVDKNGTMLYHPTFEKVGESVENSVVKGIVQGIAAGETFTSDTVAYVYKNVEKAAGYYVGVDDSFIVVITVDADEAYESLTTAYTRMILYGVLLTIVVTLILAIVIRKIVKKITEVANLVDDISNGKLNVDIAAYEKLAKQRDEVGLIAKAATRMYHSLRESFTVIGADAGELNQNSISMSDNVYVATDTISGINIAMQELAQGATSMAESVQNTASAMEEMNSNIEVIVTETEASTAKLNETMEINNAACGELDKLTEASKETAEITRDVVNGIGDSNKAVEKISMAVSMIMDISSQTNLLALNASIEAARAGEAGRGFAVVADEIKGLAEQSDKSAKDIQKIIQDIMEKTKVNTEYAERIQEAVSAEQDVLHTVLDKFNAVDSNIVDTAASFKTIDELVEKLDASKRIILDAIENLSSVSQENAASTQETSASTTELNEVLSSIGSMITGIKAVAGRLDEQAGRYQL